MVRPTLVTCFTHHEIHLNEKKCETWINIRLAQRCIWQARCRLSYQIDLDVYHTLTSSLPPDCIAYNTTVCRLSAKLHVPLSRFAYFPTTPCRPCRNTQMTFSQRSWEHAVENFGCGLPLRETIFLRSVAQTAALSIRFSYKLKISEMISSPCGSSWTRILSSCSILYTCQITFIYMIDAISISCTPLPAARKAFSVTYQGLSFALDCLLELVFCLYDLEISSLHVLFLVTTWQTISCIVHVIGPL